MSADECKGGAIAVPDRLLLGVDAVDFEALRFIEEERLVDAAGEPVVEVGGVVGADDEDVFGVGDAVGS